VRADLEPTPEAPNFIPDIDVEYQNFVGEVTTGPALVDEAALAGGSNPSSPAEQASGRLVINSPDGISSVQIQDVNGNWIDVTNGGEVQGKYGILTVDAAGNWVYTLTGNTLDHDNPNATGSADQVGESFLVRMFDLDGDVSPTVSLDVVVHDDGPSISVSGPTTVVEGESIDGTWTMVEGADGATAQVLFGGQAYALGEPIDTGKGVLTVNANGTWVFVAEAGLDNSGAQALSFSIRVTDGDLDTGVDSQSISIADGAGPLGGGSINLLVDDQNLANGTTPAGPDSNSAVLNFTAGSDPIASLKFATDLSGLNASLSWERVSDTEIIGRDGAVDVVRLTLVASADNTQATVTATLLSNYAQHPGINEDDLQQLGSVAVVATDLDGDQATGTVSLAVSDDVPDARLNLQAPELGNVKVDESLAALGGAQGDGIASAILLGATVQAQFASVYGADGAGSTVYSLALSGSPTAHREAETAKAHRG